VTQLPSAAKQSGGEKGCRKRKVNHGIFGRTGAIGGAGEIEAGDTVQWSDIP